MYTHVICIFGRGRMGSALMGSLRFFRSFSQGDFLGTPMNLLASSFYLPLTYLTRAEAQARGAPAWADPASPGRPLNKSVVIIAFIIISLCIYIYIYLSLYIYIYYFYLCIYLLYVYIYIYIYREREIYIYVYVCVCIYISLSLSLYIYICI